MEYKLVRLNSSTVKELEELAKDARKAGFRFVQRTIDEWLLRINDFSKPGESMNGVRIDGRLVAICGLNVDPYLDDDTICRVRHLYVHSEFRELGLSKILMKQVLKDAKKKFVKIRLSTSNDVAATLYEKLGFEAVKEHKATHAKVLKKTRKRKKT